VEVGTQVSGIVNKLYADYNSVVKKGELIAELDKVNLLNELAAKKSNLATAKTEYEYQLKNYTRNKTLHEKQLISDYDYETAYYNYEKAKNSYEVSKNELAKAETNLGYATIYSPIDGIVLSRAVEEGQTVAASFETPTLFTIASDLTQMQVVADVDEADIGGVKEGQRVTFTVDAYPNDTFDGEVTQVRQEATTTNNVVTYEVVINAPNPDLKLKSGLTATVSIYTIEKDNVLNIPAGALSFVPASEVNKTTQINNSSNNKSVWILQNGQPVQKNITVGVSTGTVVEVSDGLNEGDEVITGQQASIMEVPEGTPSGENSPFMPKRPGGNRNKK
ncbi:MAG: efflux RND transporter periplasmic adaptor subunit, partial [Bacteroidaceae bacterium]|nr:efflux RND transporter periplasmic adaptor subunit [Bacteroidaceae bacterium]